MGRTFFESMMGAVVLLVAGIFLVFAYKQADLGTVKGYTVQAKFSSVGGLDNGGDVRIKGVKVGTVIDQRIDPTSFEAVVKMSIRPEYRLPADTVASIDSEGMLGGKFLKLEPGKDTNTIADGGTIANTKASESLEEKVSKVIFLATGSDPAKEGGAPPK